MEATAYRREIPLEEVRDMLYDRLPSAEDDIKYVKNFLIRVERVATLRDDRDYKPLEFKTRFWLEGLRSRYRRAEWIRLTPKRETYEEALEEGSAFIRSTRKRKYRFDTVPRDPNGKLVTL